MFERWRATRRNREVVDGIYEAIVERARRPQLYLEGGLPDTVMGRYEALGIEVLLFLDRCRGDVALQALAQDLVDRFMLDMDHSLREIGIGYQGVPRRMRKLAARFYTRVADYRAPLEARDAVGMEAALRKRAYGDAAVADGAPAFLARHMLASADAYADLPSQAILEEHLQIAANVEPIRMNG